ncbi:recombinase family protein [Kocuria dechangensis]|uniref:recombinase family protein n=1 Tax=Kocuria dechangensis TaxID=1176249 RepID=UPI003531153B
MGSGGSLCICWNSSQTASSVFEQLLTTLDRLGRSTQNVLAFAEQLRGRGAGLRVLNLGGGDVDTHTPMGSMVFTVMEALARIELEIKRERITDSVTKRRAAGKDLCGHRPTFTDFQIRSACGSSRAGEPAARSPGMWRWPRGTMDQEQVHQKAHPQHWDDGRIHSPGPGHAGIRSRQRREGNGAAAGTAVSWTSLFSFSAPSTLSGPTVLCTAPGSTDGSLGGPPRRGSPPWPAPSHDVEYSSSARMTSRASTDTSINGTTASG